VSEPNAEVIAIRRDEHLRLVAKATKGDGMDDPVAIALEDIAWAAWTRILLPMGPAAR
jgi:hypothetical protein